MVTSETVPFSKSGGLADVVGALSSSMVKNGNNVKVFMPMYSFIDSKNFKKSVTIEIDMLSRKEKAYCMETVVDDVVYVGLDHSFFSERKGIYGDTSFTPYADNCERFLLFAKAAGIYLKATGFDADIVHCHDWTAGCVPYFLKEQGIKSKTVFTIHNLAYQGVFPSLDAISAGTPLSQELLEGNEMNKMLNMLKAGLETADKITTVSPTYSREIQEEKLGCGLDWLLKERSKDLTGIINGIDYNEWNPENDVFFDEHFGPESLDGKAKLKARIQAENGLKVDPDIPLFAMISRLAEQKGFSELLLTSSPSALEKILTRNNVQFIIIGTGDERYVSKLKEIESRCPNLKVLIAFSNPLAHQVEGAADFFLMPSRYEPCGLNQLYSLHYGTLPIAHKTGGLADSIIDLKENPDCGTGFLFENLNEDEIVKEAEQAILFYNEKEEYKKAVKRAMETDFTWTRSAQEYEELYKTISRKSFGGNIK